MRKLCSFVFLSMLTACACGTDQAAAPGGSAGSGGAGGAGGVGGAGGIAGGGTGGAGGEAGSTQAYDEFDAWRELLEVIRRSPDAVPARAAALVEARDAQGLFELVRDDVALLPPAVDGLRGAATEVRWGGRATLRGQAGTPRERAELLRELYVRAGFPAEVVIGAPVAGATETELLARAPQRTIRYEPTAEELARWDAALPTDPALAASLPTQLDPDGAVRDQILAQVLPLLPPEPAAIAFDATPTEVPLVRVLVDGVEQYANPNLDGALFGQSLTVETPIEAPPAGGERQLHVLLSASRSASPGELFTLAEGSWPASDVAGRTVTAAFTTAMSRLQAGQAKVGDVDSFIPLLLVRGDGLDADATQALSVIGTPVTTDGHLVERAAGGGLVIDGESLPPGPTPAEALTAVATLTIAGSAVTFPEVSLLVNAASVDGSQLPGLAADAFLVQEDGRNVVASLRRVRADAPRVVLLFDRSSSIPPEFLDGAAAVGHSLADAVFTQFPDAQVQVAALDINGPNLAGPPAATLAELDAQLATLSGAGSELWTSLSVLADSPATCIVAITDAVTDDTLTPSIASRIAAGPPVVLAGVGAVDAATAASVVELSQGEQLVGVSAANLAASVTGFLAARQAYDYRIVYRAPETGAAERQVSVSLRSPGTAVGTTSYTPPVAPVDRVALSALYLTVETGAHSVTRLLAGSAAGSAADREEVAGALFGRYVLGVEAGAPSFSTLLDEQVSERFQLEPAVDALRGGDPVAIALAAKRSLFRSPSELRFFSAALPGEATAGDVTFADGLTVTLMARRPVLGVKVVHRIDMLPLVPRETVSFSGATTSRTTTERTAALAVFESERFARNTRPLLAGKTLGLFDPVTLDLTFGEAWAGVAYPAYGEYDALAPADGSVVAFWAVHRRTGELIGVLPEGGPGEGESTAALVDRLQLLLDVAGRTGEALGYEGIKAWADLESTKVGLLGCVIMLFEGEGRDPLGDLGNSLCGAGLDAIGGQIPGFDELNQGSGDLESLYRILHVGTGVDVPPVEGVSGAACGAILGGG